MMIKPTAHALPRSSALQQSEDKSMTTTDADLIKEETLELATTLKPNTKPPIRPLSQIERNMIIHDAKKRAAGWSILFDFLTPFYYALRSPKKLAYNRPEVLNKTMDLQEALKLEEAVKSAQIKATLPGGFLPVVGGCIAWLSYNFGEKPTDPNFNNRL
ncbi:MAG: hypothetical protein H2174_06640 [Vampirovibrio sp.]|nr:hypothetical protein [Vampirovibrio sp.]